MSRWKKETTLAQIGNNRAESNGAVNTPIYLSAPYRHEEPGVSNGYDYIRTSNPTRDVLEKAIAELESGSRGFACSSGMSAIGLVFSLLRSGDHIIVSRDVYGGSYRLFEWLEENYGLSFTYWDQEQEHITSLIRKETTAVFIETPTNPLMKNTDICAISKELASYELLIIVDNTFLTPLIQKPLEEGADIVIHSATKYLGGHNDLLAGLVVAKTEQLGARLFDLHNAYGAVLSPFDCWLLMRGMKTLALRMERHEENARKIKHFLEQHPLVEEVFYPERGGMISFNIQKEEWVSPFLKAVKVFTFAESLGGVESLITYPATQTHADIPLDVRESYGLGNRLLRLSAGIEHSDDLVGDLQSAFQSLTGSPVGQRGGNP